MSDLFAKVSTIKTGTKVFIVFAVLFYTFILTLNQAPLPPGSSKKPSEGGTGLQAPLLPPALSGTPPASVVKSSPDMGKEISDTPRSQSRNTDAGQPIPSPQGPAQSSAADAGSRPKVMTIPPVGDPQNLSHCLNGYDSCNRTLLTPEQRSQVEQRARQRGQRLGDTAPQEAASRPMVATSQERYGTSPAQPTRETEAPAVVVRQYYADLNRHDGEAAQGKWHTPPPRLQDMVQQVDWFRIEDISLIQSTTATAQVAVTVIGKRLRQQPERWSGAIDLDNSVGVWKIVRMRVTPVAQHPDLSTGQTYVRQMISYAMSTGGVGNEDALVATKRRIEALQPKRLTDATARKRARAENERGLLFINNGQIAEAAQAFQAAYEADPTDVEIINNLGDAHQRLYNLQAAEPLLLRALVWAPGRANAWANLGHTYAKLGQLNEAVACYANAYRFSRNQDATRQLLQKWAVEEEEGVRTAAQQTLQLPLVQ
jgi:tetratricopeptide (TPR) repeat protein